MERTLVMIKPDSVMKNVIGSMISMFDPDLFVVSIEMFFFTKFKVKEFYFIHKNAHFFNELVDFISSGPVVALILSGENAVLRTRKIIGNTDPSKADRNTIRNIYGTSITKNAIHGSDSIESSKFEINFFFPNNKIIYLS